MKETLKKRELIQPVFWSQTKYLLLRNLSLASLPRRACRDYSTGQAVQR
jgi:hypothetical protein